jgi:hypothetical protein
MASVKNDDGDLELLLDVGEQFEQGFSQIQQGCLGKARRRRCIGQKNPTLCRRCLQQIFAVSSSAGKLGGGGGAAGGSKRAEGKLRR